MSRTFCRAVEEGGVTGNFSEGCCRHSIHANLQWVVHRVQFSEWKTASRVMVSRTKSTDRTDTDFTVLPNVECR